MSDFLIWYYPILFLVIGLCVGSFVNVVLYRYPVMMMAGHSEKKLSLFYPPSHCTNCKNKIRKADNIPVISWIILKGKCRHCNAGFSVRYMMTELVFGVVFLFMTVLYYPDHDVISISCFLILFSFLYCVFFIDIKHFLIPDVMTFPLIIMGFVFSYFGFISVTLTESVSGALIIYAIVFFTGFLFKYFRGIDGIGFGDYKLFAAGGAWVGVFQIQYLIIFSSVFGCVFYIINKFKTISTAKNISHLDDIGILKEYIIPFGPAICLSILSNVFINIFF
ncbi:A24 family peptidase [Morganella sp. EGD-HP17]|uniref:prepilin peptidase n=1 Tax=Morganella sp. EGD-HP17 TaxID=1435146 RepID=UPI0003FB7F9C|nr:A24 family peptidase [Morganella sp. EGD-HP17]